MCEHEHIRKAISLEHADDTKQLEAIFSDDPRLIIEAPAGYGKTKTMISKIAYLLGIGTVQYPKKILGLTFSVNAAYKIKKDIAERLPQFFSLAKAGPASINERVLISNYHGFCRHVLKLYGYLLHEELHNIDTFRSVDDSNAENMTNLGIGLRYDDAVEFSNLNDAIRNVDKGYLNKHWATYVQNMLAYLIPHQYISYNGIILCTVHLLKHYPEIQRFYGKYFPVIIVDEFQDTNLLGYALLKKLIIPETMAVFIGDPLQRIYGFIGAVPELMRIAKNDFGMHEVKLAENYRFRNNPMMLLLDKNLRANAEAPCDPSISETAFVKLRIFDDQSRESAWVAEKILEKLQHDEHSRIAVLVRGRGRNVQAIIQQLDDQEVDYFFALYTDDDPEYVVFHRECLHIFVDHIRSNERMTRMNLNRYLRSVQNRFNDRQTPVVQSLLSLLQILLERLNEDYGFLTNEDKSIFIRDTLENGALKQQMEHVSKRVFVSTVHGAKGLEWDDIILPDMEQYVFPNYYGLCGQCAGRSNSVRNGVCKLVQNPALEKAFLEELSVFYVAVTRGKKDVWFSSSRLRIHYSGRQNKTYVSCLLSLAGIEVDPNY